MCFNVKVVLKKKIAPTLTLIVPTILSWEKTHLAVDIAQ